MKKLKEIQKRGQLTQRIKNKSKELLGYEISQVELRFIPYLDYLNTNNEKLQPIKINQEEREILSKWKDKGYLTGGASSKIQFGKEFYDIVKKILYLGYVDLST